VYFLLDVAAQIEYVRYREIIVILSS